MAKAHEDVTATIAAFRPETATPDDVERLIDVRISQIDAQIKTHLTAAEELKTERKRWISTAGADGGAGRPVGSAAIEPRTLLANAGGSARAKPGAAGGRNGGSPCN